MKRATAQLPKVSWGSSVDLWIMPTKLFELLRGKWVWSPAYLQTVALMGVGTLLIYRHLEAANLQLLASGGLPTDLGRLIITSARIGYVISPLASPFVAPTLIAYLLLFISIFMDINVKFGKLFSLAMWSLLPFTGLRYLVQSLVLATTHGNPGVALDFSAGVFLPESASPLLKALAGQVDPFYWWTLGLLAVGYSTMMKRPLRDGIIVSCFVLGLRLALTLTLL